MFSFSEIRSSGGEVQRSRASVVLWIFSKLTGTPELGTVVRGRLRELRTHDGCDGTGRRAHGAEENLQVRRVSTAIVHTAVGSWRLFLRITAADFRIIYYEIIDLYK